MRKFILDTDWWTDCDDAVAICLLCKAHCKKEIELLGINVNACMPFSIPALDVFTSPIDLWLTSLMEFQDFPPDTLGRLGSHLQPVKVGPRAETSCHSSWQVFKYKTFKTQKVHLSSGH